MTKHVQFASQQLSRIYFIIILWREAEFMSDTSIAIPYSTMNLVSIASTHLRCEVDQSS